MSTYYAYPQSVIDEFKEAYPACAHYFEDVFKEGKTTDDYGNMIDVYYSASDAAAYLQWLATDPDGDDDSIPFSEIFALDRIIMPEPVTTGLWGGHGNG